MSGAPRHPDFQPGNTAALVHGAYSERAIAAKCDELSPGFAEWVAKRAAWAARPEFGPARINLLRASALVEMLYDDVIDTATARGSAAVPTRRVDTLLTALRGPARDALAQLRGSCHRPPQSWPKGLRLQPRAKHCSTQSLRRAAGLVSLVRR